MKLKGAFISMLRALSVGSINRTKFNESMATISVQSTKAIRGGEKWLNFTKTRPLDVVNHNPLPQLCRKSVSILYYTSQISSTIRVYCLYRPFKATRGQYSIQCAFFIKKPHLLIEHNLYWPSKCFMVGVVSIKIH